MFYPPHAWKGEHNMKTLFSHLLLMSYCLLGLAGWGQTISIDVIAAFLLTIVCVTIAFSFDAQKIAGILLVSYAAASFFYPALYLFLPMLFFEIGQRKLYFCIIPFAAGAFYQYQNTALLFFLFLCFGCILALFLQYLINEHGKLEEKNRKTRDDSTELTLLLKKRNQSLLEKQDYEIHNATLQERNRIAREIHDNVGHLLSRCILLGGAIQTINQDENCANSLQLMQDTLSQAMDNIRSSVHNLHDDSINLQKTIDTLLRDYTFCPVHVDFDMPEDIPGKIRYAFISIIKEALTNTAKHSNATYINITLREHPAMYQLIIYDNGNATTKKALVLDDRMQENAGIGLINIHDRVKLLGGFLQIMQENGFQLFISIPKDTTKPE